MEIKKILSANNLTDVFYGLGVEKEKETMHKLVTELNSEGKKLLNEINTMPKLRTYRELKLDTGTEPYVRSHLKKNHRSLTAKMRSGTFPINIELGRYKRLPVHERTCPRCPMEIEDEKHFMMDCPLYQENRQTLLHQLEEKTGLTQENLANNEIFFLIFNISAMMKPLANFIDTCNIERGRFMKEGNA